MSNNMSEILFVIHLDKFTKGFYTFICNNYNHYKLYFLFYGTNHQFDFQADEKKCFYYDSYRTIESSDTVVGIAKRCNAIIYSGLFGSQHCVFKFGLITLKKTYIHFWGNDFYALSNKPKKTKQRLNSFIKRWFINNAKGIINLIPQDYKELCKICHPKGKHYVAPMCGDGSAIEIVKSLRDCTKSISPVKILLGNSATESNQHIQALQMLEKYKHEDIMIICPLSYGGDEAYRDKIISFGKAMYKDKFTPITEYMSQDEYFKIIADCQIAIFNNNRQQAMGNINVALAMRCKVYIREDSPMWATYCDEREMDIFSVNDIEHLDFFDFTNIGCGFDKNYEKYLQFSDVKNNMLAWQKVFESIDN